MGTTVLILGSMASAGIFLLWRRARALAIGFGVGCMAIGLFLIISSLWDVIARTEREVVLVPRERALAAANWDAQKLAYECRKRLNDPLPWDAINEDLVGEHPAALAPEELTFPNYYRTDDPERKPLRLVDLADIKVRPITFTPADQLQWIVPALCRPRDKQEEELAALAKVLMDAQGAKNPQAQDKIVAQHLEALLKGMTLEERRVSWDPAFLGYNPSAGALRRLQYLRGRAKLLVPQLAMELKNAKDGEIIANISTALSCIGPFAAEAVPALSARLRDDKVHRHKAAMTLAAIGGPAVLELDASLRGNEDAETRGLAADALLIIGKEGLPSLRRALGSPDKAVRLSSANAFLGSRTRQPLTSMPAARRQQAAMELIPLLRDPSIEVRRAAAEGVAGAGPAAIGAADDLLALLDEKDERLQSFTIESLLAIGCDDHRLIEPIRRILGDKNSARRAALVAVEHTGRAAAELTPLVVACLDEDMPLRLAALKALTSIGGREAASAVKQVAELTQSKDVLTSLDAIITVESMGPDGAPAWQHVRTMMNAPPNAYSDDFAKSRAAIALGAIGPAARDALPDMVRFAGTLQDRNGQNRVYLAQYIAFAMAAIDLEAAVSAVQQDLKRDPVPTAHDQRSAVLRCLLETQKNVALLRSDLAASKEADWSERGNPDRSSFGTSSVAGAWEVILRQSRLLRPGDSLERVAALVHLPHRVVGNSLEYRSRQDSRDKAPGFVVVMKDEKFQSLEELAPVKNERPQ
jgi:HEAT repeat protein